MIRSEESSHHLKCIFLFNITKFARFYEQICPINLSCYYKIDDINFLTLYFLIINIIKNKSLQSIKTCNNPIAIKNNISILFNNAVLVFIINRCF